MASAALWDDFSIANGGRSTVTPNVTGADGEALALSFAQTAGNGEYQAMDNLAFDQVAAVDGWMLEICFFTLGKNTLRTPLQEGEMGVGKFSTSILEKRAVVSLFWRVITA
ncbi:MAG: hypothetical protein AB8D78_05235 [Akkermansiaceae bacterium]